MSCIKTSFSLLLYTIPACHISMLWISSDGRETKYVKFLYVFFVGRVIASRVGGWCRVSKGGSPGALIFILLIWWSHADMVLSGWTHVDMVWR